ncbi:MAG: hypothetical protein NZ455_10385 [Bacteroidia bacterium]|nr:hypothetical protein [Bacteroidia bacterium]MDW8345604.1 hypothetical protein [Bacteroidia bacterium]
MRRVRKQCVAQAKHRSDSAARSTPTRAQRGTRPKLKLFFRLNISLLHVIIVLLSCFI